MNLLPTDKSTNIIYYIITFDYSVSYLLEGKSFSIDIEKGVHDAIVKKYNNELN